MPVAHSLLRAEEGCAPPVCHCAIRLRCLHCARHALPRALCHACLPACRSRGCSAAGHRAAWTWRRDDMGNEVPVGGKKRYSTRRWRGGISACPAAPRAPLPLASLPHLSPLCTCPFTFLHLTLYLLLQHTTLTCCLFSAHLSVLPRMHLPHSIRMLPAHGMEKGGRTALLRAAQAAGARRSRCALFVPLRAPPCACCAHFATRTMPACAAALFWPLGRLTVARVFLRAPRALPLARLPRGCAHRVSLTPAIFLPHHTSRLLPLLSTSACRRL